MRDERCEILRIPRPHLLDLTLQLQHYVMPFLEFWGEKWKDCPLSAQKGQLNAWCFYVAVQQGATTDHCHYLCDFKWAEKTV